MVTAKKTTAKKTTPTQTALEVLEEMEAKKRQPKNVAAQRVNSKTLAEDVSNINEVLDFIQRTITARIATTTKGDRAIVVAQNRVGRNTKPNIVRYGNKVMRVGREIKVIKD